MTNDKDLQQYRTEIDRLDDEILRLLNERSKNVIEIGKLKRQSDADAHLHTPRREAEIVERLMRKNAGPFPNDAIRSVYREIMSASLSLEGPQKVAYLGPRATFTHLAAVQKFGASAQYIAVNGIKDVFDEVERGHPIVQLVYGDAAALEFGVRPGEYRSGQPGCAVNALAMPSQVRILPPPSGRGPALAIDMPALARRRRRLSRPGDRESA
jgi:chorismate mutase-like protein